MVNYNLLYIVLSLSLARLMKQAGCCLINCGLPFWLSWDINSFIGKTLKTHKIKSIQLIS